MIINNTIFSADLSEIFTEWRNQLIANNIPLLGKFSDKLGTDDIMVSCIYHKNGQESKPSAGIRRSDGMYHCFTCGETHTLQEVISHSFGHTEDVIGTWGWNWLLKNFLSIAIEERKSIDLDVSRNNSSISRSNLCNTQFISEEELDSYRYVHPYMYKRKLTDEIIEIFDIGYDRNTRCITFPIRDIYGNTLFVARRSVDTKFFNYPNGVEKPVYGLFEIMSMKTGKFKELFPNEFTCDELVICESMIDALTCWVYGKPAVALNGLGNELQFKQLNQMPFRKFILATDMDSAGQKARKRLRSKLSRKIITEYVWDINIAKDINDMDKNFFDNLEEIF